MGVDCGTGCASSSVGTQLGALVPFFGRAPSSELFSALNYCLNYCPASATWLRPRQSYKRKRRIHLLCSAWLRVGVQMSLAMYISAHGSHRGRHILHAGISHFESMVPSFWMVGSLILKGWFPHFEWMVPSFWKDGSLILNGWFPHFEWMVPSFWMDDGWFPHFERMIPSFWMDGYYALTFDASHRREPCRPVPKGRWTVGMDTRS